MWITNGRPEKTTICGLMNLKIQLYRNIQFALRTGMGGIKVLFGLISLPTSWSNLQKCEPMIVGFHHRYPNWLASPLVGRGYNWQSNAIESGEIQNTKDMETKFSPLQPVQNLLRLPD